MNELAAEKMMTTKELAEQLGTRPNVITENAKKCLPGKKIENGKTTYWTQAEVTVLLECMKSNNANQHDLSRSLIGTSTELTPALKMKKAFDMAQEAYEEELAILRAKNEAQERMIAEQVPKVVAYDDFVERNQFCNFRDASNYLHVKQTELMEALKDKYIYKNKHGEYRCYSVYSDYFALRPYTFGDKTGQQLMLTIEGLNFLKHELGKKAVVDR
jgi:phage antirepressor YoqD-like protein